MLAVLEPYYYFALKAMAREGTYRFEVFTSIGSLAVRVYLLRVVWVALYAHNAIPHGVPLHAIITYSTVALLMGLVLDIDQTRLLHDKLARRQHRRRHDETDQRAVLLVRRRHGRGALPRGADRTVARARAADRPHRRAVGAGARRVRAELLPRLLRRLLPELHAQLHRLLDARDLRPCSSIFTWVTDLLGGQIVPLVFFPAVVQQVDLRLPFAAMFSTPLLIYIGEIPPERYAEVDGAAGTLDRRARRDRDRHVARRHAARRRAGRLTPCSRSTASTGASTC